MMCLHVRRLCFATLLCLLPCHSYGLDGSVNAPPWATKSTRVYVGTTSLSMTNPGSTNREAAPFSSPKRIPEIGSINATATVAIAATAAATPATQARLPPSTAPSAIVKRVRKHAGVVLASVGFAASATRAFFVASAGQQQQRNNQQLSPSSSLQIKPLVDSLVHFLKTSGIDLELSKSINFRLLDNVIFLARIQKLLLLQQQQQQKAATGGAGDIRDLVAAAAASSHTTTATSNDATVVPPSNEEALRYMKYATAAYGDSMIRAANLDVKGDWSFFGFGMQNKLTKTRVSEHIAVPEHDIVAMDVEYGGDSNHLRHFVAVDHAHKKIVLAIRGTFTISELVVDAAGFSRPFCGGEAHSEMANMAERVWQVAGPIVKELLKKNDGYDLILTGHSLGAGVACLLNILLHENDSDNPGLLHVDGQPVKVQCFAYASPPVFAPKVQHENLDFDTSPSNAAPTGTLLELPKAALSCTNYIHEMDVVPFLSVDSIRHFFNCVAVLEEHHSRQQWWSLSSSSWLLPTRDFSRHSALLDAVQRTRTERLRTKPGAPLMAIPAATNVWVMQQQQQQLRSKQRQPVDNASSGQRKMSGHDASVRYDQKLCDPIRLATLGIHLDFRMLQDHFPSRYEHALHHLI